MGSPTTPTHGKLAALYFLRPDGFKGSGLSDVTWGAGFSGASSAYFEVVLQTEGTPDTFTWRKDGGAWTENVNITGAAQTLSDGQQITFAATTGHTADDQWAIGNLKDEACDESGAEAQITASAKRLLNPNDPPTFTDDGGETVLTIDYTQGKAVFSGNVGAVTVTGNNGFIVESGLEKIGYLIGWNLDIKLALSDMNYCGQHWKKSLPGLAGSSGSSEAFLIGGKSALDVLKDCADGDQKYFLVQPFNYDPDQDQTGDHFLVWATLTGLGVNAPLGEIVKESVSFEGLGIPSFKANA